jgi:hypothetical protein
VSHVRIVAPDGIAASHYCFACAVGIAIEERVATQAEVAIDRNGFVIEQPREAGITGEVQRRLALSLAASHSNLVTVGRKFDK